MASSASSCVVEEGVVRGGGVALIRVLKALKDLERSNEDQTVGIHLLARTLEEPLRRIVENAGEDAAVVLNAASARWETAGALLLPRNCAPRGDAAAISAGPGSGRHRPRRKLAIPPLQSLRWRVW